MAVNKLVEYPIKHLGGVTRLKVPAGSVVMAAIGLENLDDPVHVLVAEPVLGKDEELEGKVEISLLALSRREKFNEPDEDKFLQYIGSVPWDNGYKLHHIFQINNWSDFESPDEESLEERVLALEAIVAELTKTKIDLPNPPKVAIETAIKNIEEGTKQAEELANKLADELEKED